MDYEQQKPNWPEAAGVFVAFGFGSVHLMRPCGAFSMSASTSATLEEISTNDVENLNSWRGSCTRECAWGQFWYLTCKQTFTALIKPERPLLPHPLGILFIIFLLSVQNVRIIKLVERLCKQENRIWLAGRGPWWRITRRTGIYAVFIGWRKGSCAMQTIGEYIIDSPPCRAPGGNLSHPCCFSMMQWVDLGEGKFG